MKRLLLAALIFSLFISPASAHTAQEHNQWEHDWFASVKQSGLSPRRIAEYTDWFSRHPHFKPNWVAETADEPREVAQNTGSRPSTPRGNPSGGWASLVSAHFPADQVNTALRVIECESNGDPGAYNPSGATGLFQIMAPVWADHFGVSRGSLFDPDTNVRIARKVWDVQGWGAWECY